MILPYFSKLFYDYLEKNLTSGLAAKITHPANNIKGLIERTKSLNPPQIAKRYITKNMTAILVQAISQMSIFLIFLLIIFINYLHLPSYKLINFITSILLLVTGTLQQKRLVLYKSNRGSVLF